MNLFYLTKANLWMCEPFDFEAWKRRPGIQKLFEWLLLPLRHLL